jgi:hypothetical protein
MKCSIAFYYSSAIKMLSSPDAAAFKSRRKACLSSGNQQAPDHESNQAFSQFLRYLARTRARLCSLSHSDVYFCIGVTITYVSYARKGSRRSLRESSFQSWGRVGDVQLVKVEREILKCDEEIRNQNLRPNKQEVLELSHRGSFIHSQALIVQNGPLASLQRFLILFNNTVSVDLFNYEKQRNLVSMLTSITIVIKLTLCHYTPWRSLRGEEHSSYSFSTSALDGGEWSASGPSRALPPGKGPPVPIVQEAGWAPEPVWTQRIEEKSFCPCRGSNLDRSVVQPVARHYTAWATRLHQLL